MAKQRVHFKVYDPKTPDECEVIFTMKGLMEFIEGQEQMALATKKKQTFTVETLTEKEYNDELKKKR